MSKTTKSQNGKRELSDSVVLITGALTGIGRATALAFADEGSTVVIAGRREEAGKQLEAELRAKAWRLHLSGLTFALIKKWKAWWIRQSPDMAALTWL